MANVGCSLGSGSVGGVRPITPTVTDQINSLAEVVNDIRCELNDLENKLGTAEPSNATLARGSDMPQFLSGRLVDLARDLREQRNRLSRVNSAL